MASVSAAWQLFQLLVVSMQAMRGEVNESMKQWREILACPSCKAPLLFDNNQISCSRCEQRFTVENGIPIFQAAPVRVEAGHTSNKLAPEVERILGAGEDFSLHIGAGGTECRYPNCIEFEARIFRHTDVVGDAHQLPFREEVFDRVFALNVFEHLRDPRLAAREIFRVLKPGGIVMVHTAFLQSLHEEPNHFYNATEFGVREWFRDFEVNDCRVTANFGPGVMLAYLMAQVMDAAGRSGATIRECTLLGNTSISEWAEFWAGKAAPPDGFEMLQSLPPEFQRKISAGFELVARKP